MKKKLKFCKEFAHNSYGYLEVVKARKVHTCARCGGKIKKGEEYKRCHGSYEGQFFNVAYHMSCR